MLTGRNLLHIKREPLELSDVTVQPVLFTLLFVFVFGSGVVLPGGGSYKDFAIAGLLAMNLTTSAMGTAVGLSTHLGSGVIDRFRTLSMWRPAVLVGRSLADIMTAAICAAFVALTGLAIGWRPDAGAASILGGFALFLLFSYALSWGCACAGIPALVDRADRDLRTPGHHALPASHDRLRRATGPGRRSRHCRRWISSWCRLRLVDDAS